MTPGSKHFGEQLLWKNINTLLNYWCTLTWACGSSKYLWSCSKWQGCIGKVSYPKKDPLFQERAISRHNRKDYWYSPDNPSIHCRGVPADLSRPHNLFIQDPYSMMPNSLFGSHGTPNLSFLVWWGSWVPTIPILKPEGKWQVGQSSLSWALAESPVECTPVKINSSSWERTEVEKWNGGGMTSELIVLSCGAPSLFLAGSANQTPQV